MERKDTDHFMKQRKKLNWKRIICIIVFVSLAFSIVYASIHLVSSPTVAPEGGEFAPVKSDYLLMLTQCILGLIVLLLPDLINRKFSFSIPNYMFIMYYIFLYCAIYLGEVRSFYYLVPHWDSYLHAFSGGMLGALGFALVTVLNDTERVAVRLSPIFVALFAFCFALAAGAVWEIYEYTFDGLLGLNMQRYHLADGTMLVGHEALSDTISDLIIDAVGALVVSVIGFITLKKRKLPKSTAQENTLPQKEEAAEKN